VICYEQRPERLEWAARIIGIRAFRNDAKILSVMDGEEVKAVVVYDTWGEVDVSMHVASDGGRSWLSRAALVHFFAYPFIQCGKRRVTALVPAKNAHALHFDEKLGFKREGLFRCAMPGDDLVALGMLKEECRWIPRGC
jgi:L-amino acid N-acyltransferase YncA